VSPCANSELSTLALTRNVGVAAGAVSADAPTEFVLDWDSPAAASLLPPPALEASAPPCECLSVAPAANRVDAVCASSKLVATGDWERAVADASATLDSPVAPIGSNPETASESSESSSTVTPEFAACTAAAAAAAVPELFTAAASVAPVSGTTVPRVAAALDSVETAPPPSADVEVALEVEVVPTAGAAAESPAAAFEIERNAARLAGITVLTAGVAAVAVEVAAVAVGAVAVVAADIGDDTESGVDAVELVGEVVTAPADPDASAVSVPSVAGRPSRLLNAPANFEGPVWPAVVVVADAVAASDVSPAA
jgi:hypothetical protein